MQGIDESKRGVRHLGRREKLTTPERGWDNLAGCQAIPVRMAGFRCMCSVSLIVWLQVPRRAMRPRNGQYFLVLKL